jgi:signal transduction histidine kinase
MDEQKLRATLAELERELHAVSSMDDESRASLEQSIAEIRTALHEDEPSSVESEPLIDRLKETVERFEGTHPTLTLAVSRLIDVLGEMGV